MEPKLQKTIDDEFIEIRAYLCDEENLFIKLKSDVVLMIEKSRNSVKFLLPDKNGCYDLVTDVYPTKPSLGHLELNIDTSFLRMIEKIYTDKKIDRDFSGDQLDSLQLFLLEPTMAKD